MELQKQYMKKTLKQWNEEIKYSLSKAPWNEKINHQTETAKAATEEMTKYMDAIHDLLMKGNKKIIETAQSSR